MEAPRLGPAPRMRATGLEAMGGFFFLASLCLPNGWMDGWTFKICVKL